MARQLPPLSALRAFEAAARLGSFKQAADELAVTPTAISHQVRSLELHLGTALFERHTRRVVPTAAAQQLFPVLRDGFDGFARAVESVRTAGRTMITISATPAFTAKRLLPRVAAFQALHPEVDLRLHASNAVVDVASGTVDLAIRYGRGPYPDLIATPLMSDRFWPMASPRLALGQAADLAHHRLIHFEWHRSDASHPSWARWLHDTGATTVTAGSGLRFSDESHAIQAVIAGQGVGLLSQVLVVDELAGGLLHIPFGPGLEGMSYHLLEPMRPGSPAREAVKHWLLSELVRNGPGDSKNE